MTLRLLIAIALVACVCYAQQLPAGPSAAPGPQPAGGAPGMLASPPEGAPLRNSRVKRSFYGGYGYYPYGGYLWSGYGYGYPYYGYGGLYGGYGGLYGGYGGWGYGWW